MVISKIFVRITDTTCASWHGKEYERKCHNNSCFELDSFNEDRDCTDSVWRDCPEFNIKGFHCSSGECIPTTAVCDGNKNCTDDSDETDGCRMIEGKTYLSLFLASSDLIEI